MPSVATGFPGVLGLGWPLLSLEGGVGHREEQGRTRCTHFTKRHAPGERVSVLMKVTFKWERPPQIHEVTAGMNRCGHHVARQG